MEIHFIPDSDLFDFTDTIHEYTKIWEREGERIVKAWEHATGLSFKESFINAIVFKGISHSHPLSLGYDKNPGRKLSLLIHELGHRILSGRVPIGSSLENHKTLYLVFYDLLVDAYGQDFADNVVAEEKNLTETYKLAWEWALSFSKEERQEEFRKRLL